MALIRPHYTGIPVTNFSLGKTASVSDSSGSTQLAAVSKDGVELEYHVLVNYGDSAVFVNWGSSSVSASTSDDGFKTVLLSGQSIGVRLTEGETHFAFVCESGNTSNIAFSGCL